MQTLHNINLIHEGRGGVCGKSLELPYGVGIVGKVGNKLGMLGMSWEQLNETQLLPY